MCTIQVAPMDLTPQHRPSATPNDSSSRASFPGHSHSSVRHRVAQVLQDLKIADLYDLRAKTWGPVAAALGLSSGAGTDGAMLARKILELELLSPEIPLDRPVKRGFGAFYLDPGIVGPAQVLVNVRRLVEHEQRREPSSARRCTHLDNIEGNIALGAALGLPSEERHLTSGLARKFIELKLISPDIPPGHPIMRARGSFYLNPEVVGSGKVLENIISWIRGEQSKEQVGERMFTTLDDIPKSAAVGVALGLGLRDARRGTSIARRLCELGVISPELPEAHIRSSRRGSLYLKAEVVGVEQAADNARRLLQERYTFLGDVQRADPGFAALCRALGSEVSAPALRETVRARGWLIDEVHSSVLKPVPAIFRRDGATRARGGPEKRELAGIDESVELSPSRSIRFVKGEAFEQLAGLALAAEEPSAVLLPQFCLDVDPASGWYGLRVDWLIGDRLVECKWGRATANIRETAAKHRAALARSGASDLRYEIMTLVAGDDPTIEVRLFTESLDRLPGALRARFGQVAELLRSDEHGGDPGAAERYRLIRDTLYTATERMTAVAGPERIREIEAVLELMSETPPTHLVEALAARAPRAFNGLAATFRYEGQLYRGQIALPTWLDEGENRTLFRPVYTFGDLKFYDRLDRDLAVLIEYHYNRRIEDFLPMAGAMSRGVVFEIDAGRRVSQLRDHREEGVREVRDLDECAALLSTRPEDLSFVKEYVSRRGGAA